MYTCTVITNAYENNFNSIFMQVTNERSAILHGNCGWKIIKCWKYNKNTIWRLDINLLTNSSLCFKKTKNIRKMWLSNTTLDRFWGPFPFQIFLWLLKSSHSPFLLSQTLLTTFSPSCGNNHGHHASYESYITTLYKIHVCMHGMRFIFQYEYKKYTFFIIMYKCRRIHTCPLLISYFSLDLHA